MTKPKPVALIILDGWGYRRDKAYNPIQSTPTPTIDWLSQHYPQMLLNASGLAVGLPEGQIGNSEVGHLHIGAGRKVMQDLTRIDQDIQQYRFEHNPVWQTAIDHVKASSKAIHVVGLLSPGGVHSHTRHFKALITLLQSQQVSPIYLHAILDGRDVAPKSAKASLQSLSQQLKAPNAIVSMIGRYYAMDRDKRLERTEKAYQLIANGQAQFQASDAISALEQAYDRGESDEFVSPTIIGKQATQFQAGDVVIFMNFRADRARQLCHAIINRSTDLASLITLTEYEKGMPCTVAYPTEPLHDTLGEYLSKQGLSQLRLAETEKYAHVTYFLNGGVEQPFANETRELIPSPKVATYDLQPEMSAPALTQRLIDAIKAQQFDVIICNYANPDMVGHTGKEQAAKKAVAVIDDCLKQVLAALESVGGEALITADHGNIEQIYDPNTGQPHTAHTTELVPLFYYGRPAQFIQRQGALDDIAPSLLHLLNLPAPSVMTGHNLIRLL